MHRPAVHGVNHRRGNEMGSIASLLTDVLVGVILELISSGSAE
ncbi:MAG TPA: hypothetical protein VFN32_10415 [Rhodococcus sp. (in: high G+C Gram-positive bacteria)]|nr:hypothetical protein [Rhodococcus sp. (in: high G+C Gram-positive bacteria)]